MKLLQFIPIKLNFLLIAGIILGSHLDIPLKYTLISTGIFLILTGIVFSMSKYRHSISFGIYAAITTLNLGILTVSLALAPPPANHYTTFEIQKIICWHLKVRKVLKSNFKEQYIANVLGIDRKKASGRLLLTKPQDSTVAPFNTDEEILLWASAQALKPSLNPHQFDFRKYMYDKGITHRIQVNPGAFYRKTNPDKTIAGLAAKVRNTITDKLKSNGIQNDELGVIQALLLGERKEISTDTYTDYKNAGAIHILAVSGLHVGIILLLLDFLLRPMTLLANGKKLKLGAIVFLLWSFALLAGLSASVVRAVTMFSFVAYALYLNRPSNIYNILALSMFFILLVFDPLLLFQAGFQMSFSAVFFIVWMYPLLQRFWHPRNKIVRKVWQLFSVSLAAQLGVLPISLYYFHQFPGLFFVSNLVIIPFLGGLLGLGIVVILLALMNILPAFLANFYGSSIRIMNAVISWVARQDEFIIKDVSFDGMQLLLSYVILCTSIVLLSKISIKKTALFLSAILSFQGWCFYLLHSDIKTQQTIVLHQTANSVIFDQCGKMLTVYSRDTIRASGLIRNFKVVERISQIAHLPLKNTYKIAEMNLLIVDSHNILPANYKPEIILLSNSPGINLERYLNHTTPKIIIADGSNYLNYIRRWKKTCKQKKVPFHYTGEKGAYYIAVGN